MANDDGAISAPSQTFLVTGGAGFIGSHLVGALTSSGHKVRVLDDLSTGHLENLPDNIVFISGDVGDRQAVDNAMAGVDGCFHLAARASVQESIIAWPKTHRVNLTGAINVFNAARDCRNGGPVPVVYASSAAIYGDNDQLPLQEMAAPHPLTPYGADKLGCELHATVASHVFSVPTVGLRFFNVFGPRQDPSSPYSGVISIFVDRYLRKEVVTIYGDGLQVRDFIFVKDVVSHLIAAMSLNDSKARVFNVATGIATTVMDLADVLADLTESDSNLEYKTDRRGDIRKSLGDPTCANRELGQLTRVPLRQGLDETLSWLRGKE